MRKRNTEVSGRKRRKASNEEVTQREAEGSPGGPQMSRKATVSRSGEQRTDVNTLGVK